MGNSPEGLRGSAHLLSWRTKGESAVEDGLLWSVVEVGGEVSYAFELVAIAGLGLGQSGFEFGRGHLQRVGVDEILEVSERCRSESAD